MWMGIGGPRGNKVSELNTSLARGGGISGFSHSPSLAEGNRTAGNVAWREGQNALFSGGPQPMGPQPMGSPGPAAPDQAAQGQAAQGQTAQKQKAMGTQTQVKTPPPVDPGAHRPNDQAQELMRIQKQNDVIDAPTIAPPGVYDPNFNMDEAMRQQIYTGINGNHLGGMPGSQAVSGQSPSQGQDLFQGMGRSPYWNASRTDLFGRPKYT